MHMHVRMYVDIGDIRSYAHRHVEMVTQWRGIIFSTNDRPFSDFDRSNGLTCGSCHSNHIYPIVC